jgi:hypothetical protein
LYAKCCSWSILPTRTEQNIMKEKQSFLVYYVSLSSHPLCVFLFIASDCLASYATETVMQYCHGRRRVCISDVQNGEKFLIIKFFVSYFTVQYYRRSKDFR